jgi:hypothetical protein
VSGASVADPPRSGVVDAIRRPAPGTADVAAVLIGGALAGIAFGAAGGTELTRTSIVEVLMVLVSTVLVAAAVLWGRRGPLYGATALLMFALLAALTALSVLWSVVPELAYIEAGRTFAYLATFAAAIAAARLAPDAAGVVVKGVLIGALAVVAYALASRIWPGSLAETELSNRIGQPYQYWNAVGTTAALAIPAALWLGARHTGSVLGRALAFPAIGACALAILLTQSRGALAAALLGAVLWFAIVPLRLRSLPVVVIPALAGGAVGAWALSKDAFSESLQPLEAKEAVAGEFGLLVLLMVVGLLFAGLSLNVGAPRFRPSLRLRRRLGVVAVVVACAIPLVALTSVALSGTIDDRLDELTSETGTAPGEGAARVTATASSRGKYWREAGDVYGVRPGVGLGAGNFASTRLRFRNDEAVSRHAHGFVPQTLADLGIVGLLVTLALLAAWLAAALRTIGLHPRRVPWKRAQEGPVARRDWDAERYAVVALGLVAVVFGLQSLIDWTWFVPGPMAMTLVAAGFVAGRGPVPAVGGPSVTAESLPAAGLLRGRVPRPENVPLAAALLLGLAGLILAWAIWQPEASDRDTTRALELIDERDYTGAVEATESAEDANPLTPDPLLVRASAQAAAGDEAAALDSLETAVLRFPGDPQTWVALTEFELRTLDRPQDALETVRGALFLDPRGKLARGLFLEARSRARLLEARRAAAAAAERSQRP